MTTTKSKQLKLYPGKLVDENEIIEDSPLEKYTKSLADPPEPGVNYPIDARSTREVDRDVEKDVNDYIKNNSDKVVYGDLKDFEEKSKTSSLGGSGGKSLSPSEIRRYQAGNFKNKFNQGLKNESRSTVDSMIKGFLYGGSRSTSSGSGSTGTSNIISKQTENDNDKANVLYSELQNIDFRFQSTPSEKIINYYADGKYYGTDVPVTIKVEYLARGDIYKPLFGKKKVDRPVIILSGEKISMGLSRYSTIRKKIPLEKASTRAVYEKVKEMAQEVAIRK